MILIGQYDSPFVRRVGIALELYRFAFEHRPWSVFGDAERIRAFNPLRRVPTLVLDDGDVLFESFVILDHLDERAGPQFALVPHSGVDRRRALKICALATGLADKAVSLFYEGALHSLTSPVWTERCATQIADVLDLLEAEYGARTGPYWSGDAIGHADIAVACALRFVRDVHPRLFDAAPRPRLADLAGRCEALEPFRAIQQPFNPPA